VEEFLLEIEGRLVRVVIEDNRGLGGAIPTLVCRAAQRARIYPVTPASGQTRYPGMPRALASRVEREDEKVDELHLEVSELAAGETLFSLEQFAEQVSNATETGVTGVRLTRAEAPLWGAQEPDEVVRA
jgi:hypothetical protein